MHQVSERPTPMKFAWVEPCLVVLLIVLIVDALVNIRSLEALLFTGLGALIFFELFVISQRLAEIVRLLRTHRSL